MEPPNNGHIGSGGLCPLLRGVLISEGAIELYLTAILSILCYNSNVISTLTAIIACYIIVISVILNLNIFIAMSFIV